jgi:hypothetical protein
LAAHLVDLLLRDSSPTKGDTPLWKRLTLLNFARRDGMTDALTDLLRTGAQPLIATALKSELASYLAQFADLR